ncbi:unnamed protein product [Rotaria sp. Silwood1]|nr:unnamed protein product [Rotaria sp. Silwood1]
MTKVAPKLDEIIPAPLVKLEICEHRRARGAFWEKLELNHFPVDVQDLTVSITSDHHMNTVLLVQDEDRFSIINREAFFDQQEWSLYEHVTTETRETNEEYSFEHETGIEPKTHPVLAVTCRAARQPGYYYWNGFCLIFLITLCAFCIFAIPPNSNKYRPSSAMSTRSPSNKSPTGGFVKQNDNVFIMANASTFVPIREEPHKATVSENSTELHN